MPETTQRRDVKRAFTFHTAGIRAVKIAGLDGAPDELLLEGIASSTVRDRQGDTITPTAQAQMVSSAKGLTMFLNHSYDVPEDIAGTCTDASLQSASANGSDVLDLAIRCKIDPENPRAMKVFKHVDSGTKLGFSIGGKITDAEIDKDNDDGSGYFPPLLINGLELLEISVVGIPANPRAYTKGFVEQISRSAMKSTLRNSGVQELVVKTLTKTAVEDTIEIEDEPDVAIPAEVLDNIAPNVPVSAPEAPVAPAAPAPTDLPLTPDVPANANEQRQADMSASDAVLSATMLDAKRVELADLEAKLAAAKTENEKISADANEQRRAAESAATEKAKLEDEIAKLKATPTGRQTKANPGGSSESSAAAQLDADMRKRPGQLMAEIRDISQRGGATDARSTVAQ